MTYSLDLLFLNEPLFEGGTAKMQVARVFIKTQTQAEYHGINNLDYITPECRALGELEAQIDRLHEELETIRKSARRKFAAAKRNSN
jgi:hypothetical protein